MTDKFKRKSKFHPINTYLKFLEIVFDICVFYSCAMFFWILAIRFSSYAYSLQFPSLNFMIAPIVLRHFIAQIKYEKVMLISGTVFIIFFDLIFIDTPVIEKNGSLLIFLTTSAALLSHWAYRHFKDQFDDND